ncbi:hypothetical protein CGJ60_23675 [Vibrio parahaemolyticus]|uniref:DUF1889 family protein n=1 Tax=Vibrio parahaemolyticus TaxID=670 RepID=UPI0011214C4A|nr:DUF1889 family protein [Vibrio parahaemolyticus]TOD59946.1 hypothetical protein CGJ60_23675 [Vibrio parahaemolyticus]
MQQVLLNALHSLTSRVNLVTGLIHPMDGDSAKEMFKILHSNQVELNGSEIQQWASENGWQAQDAKKLGELAQKIGLGGRVQIKNKNLWGSDPYSKWQQS